METFVQKFSLFIKINFKSILLFLDDLLNFGLMYLQKFIKQEND